jgi:hypothetical protein
VNAEKNYGFAAGHSLTRINTAGAALLRHKIQPVRDLRNSDWRA